MHLYTLQIGHQLERLAYKHAVWQNALDASLWTKRRWSDHSRYSFHIVTDFGSDKGEPAELLEIKIYRDERSLFNIAFSGMRERLFDGSNEIGLMHAKRWLIRDIYDIAVDLGVSDSRQQSTGHPIYM